MAQKWLPAEEEGNLEVVVADCRRRWRSKVDWEVASAIIFGNNSTQQQRTSDHS